MPFPNLHPPKTTEELRARQAIAFAAWEAKNPPPASSDDIKYRKRRSRDRVRALRERERRVALEIEYERRRALWMSVICFADYHTWETITFFSTRRDELSYAITPLFRDRGHVLVINDGDFVSETEDLDAQDEILMSHGFYYRRPKKLGIGVGSGPREYGVAPI